VVDYFAGDTAKEELFTARKPLSANYNGAILRLVLFNQNTLRQGKTVSKGGSHRYIIRVKTFIYQKRSRIAGARDEPAMPVKSVHISKDPGPKDPDL
jgi:hypothetical protein